VLTHDGMGYAKECVVERLPREVLICRIAPVPEQLALSLIAGKVRGQPKSDGLGRRVRPSLAFRWMRGSGGPAPWRHPGNSRHVARRCR
jgi:hypothetical protein